MDALNNPNYLDRQYPNVIDTKKFGDAALSCPMAYAGTGDDSDVALRCRVLTRLYAGDNSSKFAVTIGVEPTRWNNIEQTGALSKSVWRQIVRKYPEVSLDWLWRGKDDGLPRQRSDELLAAYQAVKAAPRKTAKATSPPPKVRRRAS